MPVKTIIHIAAAAALVCSLLSGCGLTAGNKSSVIKEAVRISSERYGVEFRLKRKALFPGGAECDVRASLFVATSLGGNDDDTVCSSGSVDCR